MTSMTPDDSAGSVRLRAFTEDDFPFLDRLGTDPDVLGEFEWPGFTDPRARRRRWEHDGYISAESSAVAIVDGDGVAIGIARPGHAARGHHRPRGPGCDHPLVQAPALNKDQRS
jgi:hypothetical protein